jgi:hypothetical protein
LARIGRERRFAAMLKEDVDPVADLLKSRRQRRRRTHREQLGTGRGPRCWDDVFRPRC